LRGTEGASKREIKKLWWERGITEKLGENLGTEADEGVKIVRTWLVHRQVRA